MDSEKIADAMVTTWQGIDAALTPVIGARSVAALYKRSLTLSIPTYSWLAEVSEGLPTVLDVAPLRAVLAQQNPAAAAAGGGALLHRFYELLASLVGSPLSGRLLRSVWDQSLSGPPLQQSEKDQKQ